MPSKSENHEQYFDFQTDSFIKHEHCFNGLIHWEMQLTGYVLGQQGLFYLECLLYKFFAKLKKVKQVKCFEKNKDNKITKQIPGKLLTCMHLS